MSRFHPFVLLLTLGLAACNSSSTPGPDPAETAFFGAQPEFGAARLRSAIEVTPVHVTEAVNKGGRVITVRNPAEDIRQDKVGRP